MASVCGGRPSWHDSWFLRVCLASFPGSHASEQMSEVFNAVGCQASLLREAVVLPSLLVYGVDGVIFSLHVTWMLSSCAKLVSACLCLITVKS